MSLSFVSKAIQTTAEDGTFEEKPVENSEGGMVGTSVTGSGEGLFEQLRKNKEEADAEREEIQRSIMRGTLALDEEDAAHLDQLNKMRQEELALRQQQTAAELASFRAARADRQHIIEKPDGAAATLFGVKLESDQSAAPRDKIHVPTFIKKKRKRLEDRSEEILIKDQATIDNNSSVRTGAGATQDETNEPEKKIEIGGGGISNLLAGYSSSSDEETDGDE